MCTTDSFRSAWSSLNRRLVQFASHSSARLGLQRVRSMPGSSSCCCWCCSYSEHRPLETCFQYSAHTQSTNGTMPGHAFAAAVLGVHGPNTIADTKRSIIIPCLVVLWACRVCVCSRTLPEDLWLMVSISINSTMPRVPKIRKNERLTRASTCNKKYLIECYFSLLFSSTFVCMNRMY